MGSQDKGWKAVSERDIRLVFVCTWPACSRGNGEIMIFPSFLNDCGLPVCDECGEELEFSHAEINGNAMTEES